MKNFNKYFWGYSSLLLMFINEEYIKNTVISFIVGCLSFIGLSIMFYLIFRQYKKSKS